MSPISSFPVEDFARASTGTVLLHPSYYTKSWFFSCDMCTNILYMLVLLLAQNMYSVAFNSVAFKLHA